MRAAHLQSLTEGKGRENKGDEVTALTAYGIETNIYKETYTLHRASDIALKDLHKKRRLIYEKRE